MRAREEKIAIVRAAIAKRAEANPLPEGSTPPPEMSDDDCLRLYRRVQRNAVRGTLVPNEVTPKGKPIPQRGRGELKKLRAWWKRERKARP